MDTHEDGLYNCGYAWEWPLLLWLRMGMVSTIVVTHGNALYTIVVTQWPLLLWLRMGMVSTI